MHEMCLFVALSTRRVVLIFLSNILLDAVEIINCEDKEIENPNQINCTMIIQSVQLKIQLQTWNENHLSIVVSGQCSVPFDGALHGGCTERREKLKARKSSN